MSAKTKIKLASVILIVAMLASWVLNFGWWRMIASLWMFPIVQPILFFVGNALSAKLFAESKTARCTVLLSCVTFLLPHLLICDGGDAGNPYIFFGLIEHKQTVFIATAIGIALLILHAAVLFAQYANYFLVRFRTRQTQA